MVLQAGGAEVGVRDDGDDVEDEQHERREPRAQAEHEQDREEQLDAGAEQRGAGSKDAHSFVSPSRTFHCARSQVSVIMKVEPCFNLRICEVAIGEPHGG